MQVRTQLLLQSLQLQMRNNCPTDTIAETTLEEGIIEYGDSLRLVSCVLCLVYGMSKVFLGVL